MDLAWFLLIAPLAATIAILLNLHKKPNYAIGASVGSAAVCFLTAIAVVTGAIKEPTPFEWISLPGWNVDIGMIFDPLSKGMLMVVTGVGLLIHIYSIGYMAHDPSKGRFFGGLSIFMFSMTGIVIADNLIEMFIFWEGVGLSSYLLIGFWYQKESAAQAANKAFVCNRLADFGFMIGILTFWMLMSTVSVRPEILAECYHSSSSSLPQVHSTLTAEESAANQGPAIKMRNEGGIPTSPILLFVMVFGLFCGCIGKSAMFPLHVWLPDAMEGPTPVSALIHAATMVAAGVYMLCRVYPLLLLSEYGMDIIALIGCFTAIFAALIAVQQNDIKRILAYSTLSQLGYMVMAVGCGGPDAAMFHLTTHAFFKALLFLAAGSVIHALHDEQDIWKMGGLYNKIPLTFWTFAIGMVALSGLPPFAGFWSKDYVLSVAYSRGVGFYWVGVITAALTAFYMTRLMVVAFFGPARTREAEHPHESPKVMTIPLIILAVLSAFGGFIGIKDYYHGWSSDVLNKTGQFGPIVNPIEAGFFLESIVPGLVVLLGIGGAIYLYWDCETDPLDIKVLANKFYFDEVYDRSIVGGQQLAARFLAWIDAWILDGLIIRGSAYVTFGVGEVLRLFQTGSLQGYAFFFSLGGLLLIYFTLFAH